MSEDKFAIRRSGWTRGSDKGYRPGRLGGSEAVVEPSDRKLSYRERKAYERRKKAINEALRIKEEEKKKKIEFEERVNNFYILLNSEQKEVFGKTREYGLVGLLGQPGQLRSEYTSAKVSKNLEILRDVNLSAANYLVLLEECEKYKEVCKIALYFNNEPKTPVANFFEKLEKLKIRTKKLQVDISQSLDEMVNRK